MAVITGFRKTAVGTLPEDWPVRQLDELKPFVTSGSRGWASYYAESGGLFVRITNLSRESIRLDLTDCKYVRLPIEAREGVRTHLQEGDVLISITADIGIVGYVDARIPSPAYINQHIALVRLDSTNADGKFISYFLASDAPQRVFRSGTDTGAKAGMSLLTIRQLLTAVPPLAEQRAIAAALSDVDSLLEALDRLIAKKRDLKRATMQQLLTGKTRLPGCSGDWEVRLLGEVANVEKGVQLHSSESDAGGRYPHFNGGISPSGFTHKTNMPADTIAISEGGNSCGHVQFISEPFWCGGHCYTIVPIGVDKRFLYQALKGQQLSIMGLRVGSGLPNVQKTALVAFKIRLPRAPAEQAALAAVLSDLDAELATLAARRDKTHALKQAMMQELLTGKTRLVTGESAHA